MVVEWHLSVGNVNVDLSLILDGFGVGGATVNYASCIVRLGGRASVVSLVSPHAVRLGVLE